MKPHDGESQEDFIARCKSEEGIEHKAIILKLDDEKEGSFTARIATLDVIDLDGDVTLASAFPDGKVILISAYMHASWMGSLPVGKAVIREEKGEVLGDGEFNLKTDSGMEHYQAVKFSGELQEWSYGFKILEVGSDKEVEAWVKAHGGARPDRIIKKLDPFEMSPVLLGAGIDTATLSIKSRTNIKERYEAICATLERRGEL